MELLTSETDSSKGGLNSGNSFLNTLAKAEPSAEWLMNWLHDNQLRPLATPRLAEMIVEILDKAEQNVSFLNLSSLLYGIVHSPFFEILIYWIYNRTSL